MADKDIRRTTAKGLAPSTPPAKGRPNSEGKDYEGTPLSMTGIRSGLLHSTFMKVVLGLLILIFAVSFLFTSSRLPSNGLDAVNNGNASNAPATVAAVGTEEIQRDKLNQVLANQIQQMAQYQPVGVMELLATKSQALQSLSENAVQVQAAAAAGITATDADVDKEINKQIDETIKGEKARGEAEFRRSIEAKYPGGEADLRAELTKNYDREAVRKYVLVQKYQDSIKATAKPTEDDYKKSVTKLQLRQIVLRPKLPGPTEKDFKAAQDKNAAEAKARAEKLVAGLKGKSGAALTQAFIALAKTQSDDTATKAKGGELGFKLPSELPLGTEIKNALTDAKTPLVGPLQDEVSRETSIFLIENRKLELPKDYAAKKAKYLKDFQTSKGEELWAAKQQELKKATVPEILDPALAAYKIQTEDLAKAPADKQAALRETALAKYQEGLSYASLNEQMAIRYQMAQLYNLSKQPAKALEVLQAAVRGNAGANGAVDSADVSVSDAPPAIRIELARALREAKKPKEALAELKAVSKKLNDSPSSPNMFGMNPDDATRQELAREYSQLGEQKLAQAELKAIKPPQGGGMPPGMSFAPSR